MDSPSDSMKNGLERMEIYLGKYAYFRHIGADNLIKTVGQKMSEELLKQKHEPILTYIEIYGHWNVNETKLETELLMCLK